MNVIVIGTGYVGLPLAIMLAQNGHKVVGVDINEKIVEAINSGILNIDEETLEEIMKTKEVRENLIAKSCPCEGDVFVISVPTPAHERKKVCDLSAVQSAIQSIIPYLRPRNLIILESTIPPLTCREVITPMLENHGFSVGEDILLAHCPERILPGDIFNEIVNNDRIIGGVNKDSCEKAKELYSIFVKGALLETDDVTAELAKLVENTYRDVNIALANELAEVCEGLNVDVNKVIDMANKHPRVHLLRPDIGVGGHCIPVDPWFIKEIDPYNCRLITMARMINDEKPNKIALKIKQQIKDIVNPRLLVLGVAYKPNTSDCRESPALRVIKCLEAEGVAMTICDPLIENYKYEEFSALLTEVDAIVILVKHDRILKDVYENMSLIEEQGIKVIHFYGLDDPQKKNKSLAYLR